MPSKTISVTNGDGSTRTITIPDRSRFAGVKTFSRNGKLDDNTTSIQVTVSGHSDLDGIYTGSGGVDSSWAQQGGNGQIITYGYNTDDDYQLWFIVDNNDLDPNGETNILYQWFSSSGTSPFAWSDLPSSHNVTITALPETVTVNRTAPVITSDRKGASRPLLSKLVGGAAAAYSLRDLNDKAGNNKVVRVRRASDNAERDFLAKEVSNGTLEAWVNADYVKYTSDFSAGDNGWGSFDGVTETGNVDGIGGLDNNLRLAIGSATSQHRGFRSNILPVNQKINFSARVFIPSTNSAVDGILIRDAVNNEIISTTAPAQDQWVTVTASNVTVTNAQLRINLMDGATTSFAGNGSDVVYLREVTVTQVTSDGFVSKWYDQSGNERHAEQGASANQPKIVNSGSLVKLSDAPAISFDGSSQFLSTTGFSFSPSGDFLAVTVSKISNGNLIDTRDGGGDGFFLQQGSSDFRHRYNGDGSINVSGNDQHIVATAELNGTTLTAYKNGASAGTDTVTAGLSTTTDTTIGRVSFTNANHVAGSIQEIILYDTDQSANRPAIEANINNQYEIY